MLKTGIIVVNRVTELLTGTSSSVTRLSKNDFIDHGFNCEIVLLSWFQTGHSAILRNAVFINISQLSIY